MDSDWKKVRTNSNPLPLSQTKLTCLVFPCCRDVAAVCCVRPEPEAHVAGTVGIVVPGWLSQHSTRVMFCVALGSSLNFLSIFSHLYRKRTNSTYSGVQF